MFRFLKEWFWDIDEPPDRIGLPGLIIIGSFLVFCIFVLFRHESSKTAPQNSRGSVVQPHAHPER